MTELNVFAELAKTLGPILGGVVLVLWMMLRENAKAREFQRDVFKMFHEQSSRVEAEVVSTRVRALAHAEQDQVDHERIADEIRALRTSVDSTFDQPRLREVSDK